MKRRRSISSLTDRAFGCLTVKSLKSYDLGKSPVRRCECKCGAIVDVESQDLKPPPRCKHKKVSA